MATVTSNVFEALVTAPPVYVPGEPWGYKVNNDGRGISQGGTFIDGGRGYDPIYITNTNASGSGSYQAAIEAGTPGHIVFEAGGSIDIGTGSIALQDAADGNKTVWGNTAPGGHLNVNGGGPNHIIKTQNVIIKHIAMRGRNAAGIDICYVNDNGNSGSIGRNVLIENCSFAFGSDETFGVKGALSNNNLANVTFYKCLSVYPLVDPGGTGTKKHCFNGIWQARDRMACIESVMAHAIGRPLIRPTGHMAYINTLFFMWSGGQILTINDGQGVTTGDHANARFRLEGNKFVGNSAGVTNYSGSASSISAPNGIGQTYGSVGAVQIYVGSGNSMGGFSWTGPIPSRIVGSDAGFDEPDGYSSRLQVGSDLDDAWLDTVGANPSTSDSVDTQARAGIKNPSSSVVMIDHPSDIGGVPTYSQTTHLAERGETLQTWLEREVGTANYHDVMPGYTNRTKIEVALDSFVSGVPT